MSKDEREIQDFFKKLLNWRKNNNVIHNGKLIQFAPKDEVYSYFRILEDKMVWVILNRNDSSKRLDISRFEELISEKEFGFDLLNEKAVSLKEDIEINKKSALIIEID